jgi:lipopolysaccharide heptosyltransferase I
VTQHHEPEDRGGKRVLLVRLGSLGDILHALPTLVTLKENFPQWELDWLVEGRWRELLEGNPFLTRIVEFDTLGWRTAPFSRDAWGRLRQAVRLLRERRYDCALDLQGAIKSAIASRLSGAVEVVGFQGAWLREQAAGLFYTRHATPDAVHVVEANLALAKALGAKRVVIGFPLPAGDKEALPKELPRGDFAVVNPGAGWTAKQWSVDGYAQICDALEKSLSLPVVLNCGPGEETLAGQVREACRSSQPFVFSGELAGLIALLRRARILVGPDTGPLHLAAALGVPTVGLYGPTDPRRNGPYGNRGRTLRPENASTSYQHSAPPDGVMERIRPEQVLEAIQELLVERRERVGSPSPAAT